MAQNSLQLLSCETTLLRFAHAFESGGGTERYLDDLDRALLERNTMTVVRMHLTRSTSPSSPIEEKIGKGVLIRVPLKIQSDSGQPSPAHDFQTRPRFKQKIRDSILYNPLVWNTVGALYAARYRLTPKPGQAIDAGKAAAKIFHDHKIDLVMMHFFGGADADEVIIQARKAGVSFAILNHYSNDRFQHLAIRKHAIIADAVAGVNGLDVPSYVRNGFTNLSDGIDIDFFSRAKARPLPNPPKEPVILLPARVTAEKGQADLVQAVADLRKDGINCCIAFAGRTDSSGFLTNLQDQIKRSNLGDRVHFLGSLDLGTLRDWYAASTIVALPTYHQEGLPRVILEAQATGAPMVAYGMGGVAEGIIQGESGYVLKPGDVAGLRASLQKILSSPALQKSMGERGRIEAEKRFSLSALADRHEQFYAKVIASNRTRHRT